MVFCLRYLTVNNCEYLCKMKTTLQTVAAPGCHSWGPRSDQRFSQGGQEVQEMGVPQQGSGAEHSWGSTEAEAFCLNGYKILHIHRRKFNELDSTHSISNILTVLSLITQLSMGDQWWSVMCQGAVALLALLEPPLNTKTMMTRQTVKRRSDVADYSSEKCPIFL